MTQLGKDREYTVDIAETLEPALGLLDTDHHAAASALALHKGTLDHHARHLCESPPHDSFVRHETGVSIFNGDPDMARRLGRLMSEFADVFQDTGFANLPVDEQMRVLLRDD